MSESRDGLNGQARNPAGLPDSSGDLASAGGIAGVDIKDHRRQVGTPREITHDVAHWLALLSEGKATLSRSEMWDIASVISRLNEEAHRISEHSAAADVLERVASTNCSDPATDDLTVPLAIKLAEAEKRIAKSCDDQRYADSDAGCPRALAAEARLAEATDLVEFGLGIIVVDARRKGLATEDATPDSFVGRARAFLASVSGSTEASNG